MQLHLRHVITQRITTEYDRKAEEMRTIVRLVLADLSPDEVRELHRLQRFTDVDLVFATVQGEAVIMADENGQPTLIPETPVEAEESSDTLVEPVTPPTSDVPPDGVIVMEPCRTCGHEQAQHNDGGAGECWADMGRNDICGCSRFAAWVPEPLHIPETQGKPDGARSNPKRRSRKTAA